MQYFVLDFGTKKDIYNIVRKITTTPVRFEIQSVEDPRYVAEVHYDVDDNKWKFIEQIISPDPTSLTGEKLIEYLIREESSVQIYLMTEETKPFISSVNTKNTYKRKVVATGSNLQVVMLLLKPDEEIGQEIHSNTDQYFQVVSGKGLYEFSYDDKQYETTIEAGDIFLVQQGMSHNVKNVGNVDLHLVSIYGPPKDSEGLTEF